MGPQEEGLIGGPPVQPCNCVVHDHGRLPLRVFAELAPLARHGHLVVVHGETVVESEHLLQNCGAYKRRGVPTLLLENPRERVR